MRFIPYYHDPSVARFEFMGFALILNEEMTGKCKKLVGIGEGLLRRLPWTSDYEKNVFQSAHFSCVDTLAFASCHVPLGFSLSSTIKSSRTRASKISRSEMSFQSLQKLSIFSAPKVGHSTDGCTKTVWRFKWDCMGSWAMAMGKSSSATKMNGSILIETKSDTC